MSLSRPLIAVTLALAFSASATAFAAGDAARGKVLSYTCLGCHGIEDYRNAYPDYNVPRLSGQHAAYIVAALKEYRNGERQHPTMQVQAATLSDQDMADIAAYFASQKGRVGAADPKIVARGEALFRGGNLEKGLPACTGCHSPNGAGNAAAGFPHLGGQHAQYIAKQLTDFRKEEGGRANDGDAMTMRTIARKLSDEDIAAVSSYIQGLH